MHRTAVIYCTTLIVMGFTLSSVHADTTLQADRWIDDFYKDINKHRIDVSTISSHPLRPVGQIGSNAVSDVAEWYLESTKGIVRQNSALWVADYRSNQVLVGDLSSNEFVQGFGMSGEGPGEFTRAEDILVDNDHIYVFDSGKRGVHVFNMHFQVEGFVRTGFGIANSIALSDGLLLVPSRSANEHLFEIRESAGAYSIVGRIGARVPGDIPGAYAHNQALIAGNEAGLTAMAWYGLPYVVLYDSSHEVEYIIKIEGLEACRRNPHPDNNRVSSCFNALKMGANGDVFVASGNVIVRLPGLGREHQHALRYTLTDGTSANNVITPFGLAVSENEVIVSTRSSGAVYRYILSEPSN